MTNEVWLAVPGYEAFYEVSSLGRVRSKTRIVRARAGGARQCEHRILRPAMTSRGYLSVVLCTPSGRRTELVHRLVASAFLANEQQLPVVNHKDGDQSRNTPENLEWCTQQHNVRHARAMGRIPHRKDTHRV